MTQGTKRAYLVAEKATLEGLVSTLDDDSVLERVGLESRLRDVASELASLDAATVLTTTLAEMDLRSCIIHVRVLRWMRGEREYKRYTLRRLEPRPSRPESD